MSDSIKRQAQIRFHQASDPDAPRPIQRKINLAMLKKMRQKELEDKKEDTQESFMGKFDSLGKKVGKIARRAGRMGS